MEVVRQDAGVASLGARKWWRRRLLGLGCENARTSEDEDENLPRDLGTVNVRCMMTKIPTTL